jgi:predicted RNase H-like HicB family nuclease
LNDVDANARAPNNKLEGERLSTTLTAIIERENSMYVALCPELDIASQGQTIEQARSNLMEALTLFFETASEQEVQERMKNEIYITQVEIPIG